MSFPEQVIDVKEEMQRTGDDRLEILKKLTESEQNDNKEECEKLWMILYQEHRSFSDVDTSLWVYSFLDAVKEFTQLPERFYMSSTDRKENIKKIKSYTGKLKKLYLSVGLDSELILNNGQFFHGFQAQEGCFNSFDKCDHSNEKREVSKVSITETLDFFSEYAEEELSEASYLGKKADNIKAIRFARLLAERNMERYGKQLEEVIENAIILIYNVRYSEQKEFLEMLNRYKNSKKVT